jgi:hypothetical protein
VCATLRPYWLGRARMIAAGVRRRLPPGDRLALTSDPMSVPEQRPVRLGGALQRGARASMSRQNHATEVARPRELVHLRALALTCCFSNGFVFERPSRTFPASPASPVCSSPDTRSRGRPGEAPLVRFRSPSAHVSHAA